MNAKIETQKKVSETQKMNQTQQNPYSNETNTTKTTKNKVKISETQKNLIKEIKFVRNSPIEGMTAVYICGINIMLLDTSIGEHVSIELLQDKDVGLGYYRNNEMYSMVRDRLQTIFWVGDIIANLQKMKPQPTSFDGVYEQ